MPEIVNLFQIDIDVDAVNKDLEESRKAVERLKTQLKELKRAEKENNAEIEEQTKLLTSLQNAEKQDVILIAQTQKNITELLGKRDDLNASIVDQNTILKVNQKEQRELQNIRTNSIQAVEAETESNKQLQRELSVVTILWNNLSKEERRNTEEGKKLTKRKKELTEALKDEEAATGDARRNVGNYKDGVLEAFDASGKFSSGIPDVIGGVKNLGNSFKALLANPVVLVLAAIVGTLKLLFDAFKKTQGGADSLNNISAALGAGLEALVGILSKLAEFLVFAFTSPKQALLDLGKAIKENIINRLVGIVNFLPSVGKAISQAFSGDFSEAAKTATDAIAKVALGVDDFSNKAVTSFNEVTTAIEKSAMAAVELANATAKYEEANIKATTSLAKYNSEAELQQGIADDATISFEERTVALNKSVEASKKASALQLNIAQKELQLIKFRNDRLKENNQLLRSNRQEEADLVAKVIELKGVQAEKERRFAQEARQLSLDAFQFNLDTLIDNFDNIKTINEAVINDNTKTETLRRGLLKETRRLSNDSFKEQINEIQSRTEQEVNANELLTETDSKRLLGKIRGLKLAEAEEVRLLEIIRERRTVLKDLAESEVKIDTDKNTKLVENRKAFAESEKGREAELAAANIFTELESQKNRLESKKQQELEFAKKIGADTVLIEKRYALARKEIAKAEFEAKSALAFDFLGNLANAAGEGTAIAKTAAVAQTTIETYKSATSSFSALSGIPIVGPALGAVAAAAAVASGIANVSKILSVDDGLGGGSGGGGGSSKPSVPATPSISSPRASQVSDVNAGVISRDTNLNSNNDLSLEPILVVDDVTASQNEQMANDRTSLL